MSNGSPNTRQTLAKHSPNTRQTLAKHSPNIDKTMATGRWFPDPLPFDDIAVNYIISAHKLGIPITLIHNHVSTHDYDSDEAKISKVLRENNIFSLKLACHLESGTWQRYLLYLIRKHEPKSLAHLMTLADERYGYGLANIIITDSLIEDYFRFYIEHQTNLVQPLNEGAEFRGALWIATAFMDLRYNIEHVFHDITSKRYRTGKDMIMELYAEGYYVRKAHTGSNEPFRPQKLGDVDLVLIRYCAAAHVMGMRFDHILMMAELFGERIFTEAELVRGLQ